MKNIGTDRAPLPSDAQGVAPACRRNAAQAARPAFEAAVAYLDKRAQKGKLARTGPDHAPLFNELCKIHVRQPGKTSKMLVSPDTTTATVGANAMANGVRVGTGLAKMTKTLAGGAEVAKAASMVEAGLSSAGMATNGVGLATHSVKYHNLRVKKKQAIGQMVQDLEKARQHLAEPENANAETAAAYRRFMAAAKVVVRKGTAAGLEGASDGNLAERQSGATVGVYAVSTGRSMLSVASACANTAATAPVGAFLGAGMGIAEGVAAAATLEAGRRKSRSLGGKLAVIESWRFRNKNIQELNLPVVAIANACKSEMGRQERLANWVKRGAKVQIAKATSSIGLGIAGGVIASLGLAAVAGAAVLTGGIAIGIAGAAIGAAYLGYVGVRVMRNARAERHGKRRQKEAQALIATHTPDELRRLMSDARPEQRRATAVTVERGGFLNLGKRKLRVTTVDAGHNAYVGLHLMAQELADMIGRGARSSGVRNAAVLAYLAEPGDRGQTESPVSKEAGLVLRLLQASGMSAFEIQTLCDAASARAGEDQLCYLKQAIAGAIGIPFRVGSDGEERPLTPFAWLGPVQDLMADGAFAAAAASTDPAANRVAAETLFARVDYERFAKAMSDPALPSGEQGSAAWFARKLLSDEKQRH